jgi:hypothetical protein
MNTESERLDPGGRRVFRDDTSVNPAAGHRGAEIDAPTLDRLKERRVRLVRMSGKLQVSGDSFQRRHMHRHKPNFVALAMNANVLDATAVLKVAHFQAAEFFAPQPVIKKNRQNPPVTLSFQRGRIRSIQQQPGLRVADERVSSCAKAASVAKTRLPSLLY